MNRGWQAAGNNQRFDDLSFNLNQQDAELLQKQFTYGKMFDELSAFYPVDEKLISLGNSMHDKTVKERSVLPAGYTFLGQFIDHDLSFDPRGHEFPGDGSIDPTSLLNQRSPFLNLDILYGNGPVNDSRLYENNSILLKLGKTEAMKVKKTFHNDLPREIGNPKAVIVDSRQDENLAIAQTHVAFVKFHNAVVEKEFGGDESLKNFEKVKELVIRHYQWIVLHDFLPRVIRQDILNETVETVQRNEEINYRPDKDKPFMPVEFSAAAFRMGHSMVPETYDWNKLFPDTSILRISAFTGRGKMDNLRNVYILPSRWVIDWTRFYDFTEIDEAVYRKPTNFSLKIDTSIIRSFKFLFSTSASDAVENNYRASLVVRNLFRGRMMELPTGQDVALKLNLDVIAPAQITDGMPDAVKDVFAEQTPLWYYILREAEIESGGERLGQVGSRIVAETIVKLLKLSPISILNNPDWRPALCPELRREKFGMVDLLIYMADRNKKWNELNPLDF